MKLSVFIATSTDGYIATVDGGIEWIEAAGNTGADMGKQSDMGFNDFMSTVDCLIMGRKCMEKLSSFNLPEEQWPYGSVRIIALSHSIKHVPDNLRGKVEMCSGDPGELVGQLEAEGYNHAYIDGGSTITDFINHKLITDMVISRVPVLLGSGIPLFGKLDMQVKLGSAEAIAYPNDFITTKYKVSYL